MRVRRSDHALVCLLKQSTKAVDVHQVSVPTVSGSRVEAPQELESMVGCHSMGDPLSFAQNLQKKVIQIKSRPSSDERY